MENQNVLDIFSQCSPGASVRQQHVFTLIRTGMEEAGPTRAGKSRAMHYKWLGRAGPVTPDDSTRFLGPLKTEAKSRAQNWTEFKKK